MNDDGKIGQKNWFFADAKLPSVTDIALEGEESIVVLNPNNVAAVIEMIFYFEHPETPLSYSSDIEPETVKSFCTKDIEDINGRRIPEDKQYSFALLSDQPLIVQYKRLENIKGNLAFFSPQGYYE
ncbi:MAG: sensory rhodopsin transducer [Saccharofermentanales bacterium]|jgi:hypothetical protein